MTDLWNSSAGPNISSCAAVSNVGRGMDMARLQRITKNKAHITEQAVAQISTPWGLQDGAFFHAHGSRRSANGDARAGTLRHADRSSSSRRRPRGVGFAAKRGQLQQDGWRR